jgi:hypothetical protein
MLVVVEKFMVVEEVENLALMVHPAQFLMVHVLLHMTQVTAKTESVVILDSVRLIGMGDVVLIDGVGLRLFVMVLNDMLGVVILEMPHSLLVVLVVLVVMGKDMIRPEQMEEVQQGELAQRAQ